MAALLTSLAAAVLFRDAWDWVVAVGGIVAVGGMGVAVGGMGVAVGGMGVAVGGMGVAVAGMGVAVGEMGGNVAVAAVPGHFWYTPQPRPRRLSGISAKAPPLMDTSTSKV